MKELITMLLVEPGVPCRMVMVENSIKAIQGVIGGHAEQISCSPDPVVILCNEDGKRMGLPMNRVLLGPDRTFKDILHGTFLVVETSSEEFVSMSPDMAMKYTKKYLVPDRFRKKDGHLMVEHYENMD